jgi:hypothetical protein
MSTIEELQEIVSDIKSDIGASKTVIEQIGEEIPTTIAMYSDVNTRNIVITVPRGETFNETLANISKALHLYVYTDSHACVISMRSTIVIEDNNYLCLTMYILSEDKAYILTIPYTRDTDVTWYNELAEVTPVDDQEFDEQGKDMITMFYIFINNVMPQNIFTPEEILSYLSSTDAAVKILDDKTYSFFDFSPEEEPLLQ